VTATDDRWPLESTHLRDRMAAAAADPVVPGRIRVAVDRFGDHRKLGLAELDDADGLRHQARALKTSILAELPDLVGRLRERAEARGVVVHEAADADAACRIVAGIAGGKRVVKSKSMATEEIGLEAALEATGAHVVETDLGEWIIQLARETPSHIIAPAVHHDRHTILEVFERVAGAHGVAAEPAALNAFARERLRTEFLAAEVGITGVNFAVADTGSLVLVTNEGNGRMVTSLPPVHVAVLGVERLVRNWAELDLFLGLLTRSATGQRLTSYTSILSGPRRPGEPDGPDELHLVIVDNGRTDLRGGRYEEMLGCLRCGACLNVCPVYRQTGGHAYGWVYPGPMGAVLTPLLAGGAHAAELPKASTLCGACMDACPVEIPLQDLLLHLRQERAEHRAARTERVGWRAWAEAWSRPAGYRASVATMRGGSRLLGSHARHLPGASAWAAGRSLPSPARTGFAERWAARVGKGTVVPARPAARPSPIPSPRPPLDPAAVSSSERSAEPAAGDARGSGEQRVASAAAHPRPAPTRDVPTITYATVDPTDLLASFVRTATDAGARVHVLPGSQITDDLLEQLVREHDIRTAVTTGEPESASAAARLARPLPPRADGRSSIAVGHEATRDDRAAADLGITSATALIAATGSLAIDASVAGDRTTSLLPRVHLAIVPADRLVATPADVFHRYDHAPDELPSNLVLVTGPSRTGDIEQLLTIGVHGPHALEIVVLT
jgi:L-lactate dehydrogenase complex protein LldF